MPTEKNQLEKLETECSKKEAENRKPETRSRKADANSQKQKSKTRSLELKANSQQPITINMLQLLLLQQHTAENQNQKPKNGSRIATERNQLQILETKR